MAKGAVRRCDNNPKKWMIDTTITFKDGRRFHLKKRGYSTRREAIEDYDHQVELAHKRLGYKRVKENAGALIEAFLEFKKARVRLSTYLNIKAITLHFSHYFYKNAVKNLFTASKLEKIRNEIANLDLSRARKNKIIGTFKQVVELAYIRSMVNENHLKLVRLTMIPLPGFDVKAKHKIWTIEQYKKFIATFEDNDKYKVIFQWLFFSGCRIGEAVALTWSDYDQDKKVVSINKTASSRVGLGKAHIEQTKTKAGTRYILLNDAINERIAALKDTYYSGEDSYIFFGGKAPIGQTNIRRVFDKHTKLANLPRITIHEIRHSNNTWLIQSCMTTDDINIIAARLGRSSLKTTMDDYFHTNPIKEVAIVNKLEIE